MSQWIQDHQALLLLAWPALTAIFSLVYTQLDKLPRVHAFFSVLASLGIDLPKLFDALGRLFAGGKAPPSGGGTVTQLPKPMTPQAKDSVPPTMRRNVVNYRGMPAFFTIVAIGLACFLAGCGLLTSTTLPSDVVHEYECVQQDVEAGQSNVIQIVADCKAPEEQMVIDAINALLGSKEWTTKHPALVPALKMRLGEERARLAAKAAGQ